MSDLIGLNELAGMDRWELERRARELAAATYLGQSIALCRLLGRYKFYVATTDVGFGAHVILDGFWESWLTAFVASRVKPGWTVADVGANHGYYTLLLADLVGSSGRVAAIEPNSQIASLLRRSVSVNGFDATVTIFESAVGAQDGTQVSFYLPPNEPKNARVLSDEAAALAPQERLVTTSSNRMATLLADWPPLDFLKIDVEGAEEDVVEGLFPLLERDRPDMVLEFNVARCREPRALLARLSTLYGGVKSVEFDSKAHDRRPEALLDSSRHEDWLLYFSVR